MPENAKTAVALPRSKLPESNTRDQSGFTVETIGPLGCQTTAVCQIKRHSLYDGKGPAFKSGRARQQIKQLVTPKISSGRCLFRAQSAGGLLDASSCALMGYPYKRGHLVRLGRTNVTTRNAEARYPANERDQQKMCNPLQHHNQPGRHHRPLSGHEPIYRQSASHTGCVSGLFGSAHPQRRSTALPNIRRSRIRSRRKRMSSGSR
jgi:hypothetical protein